MKSDNKEAKLSFWAAHATTVVSVTLVLIIIGIIAMVTLCTSKETQRLREQIEISVVMADSISDEQAGVMMKEIKDLPAVKSCTLVTKAQALAEWKSETDENIEEIFGVNIFSPEVTFTLRSEYAVPDSIMKIENLIATFPGVEEVATPDSSMVENMNSNISTLSLILALIAGVMLVISFVLINNTVHLAIHSRRFTIHTMQLVGATNSFIRRPHVLRNMQAGAIAGCIASVIIALAFIVILNEGFYDLNQFLNWEEIAIIAGALILLGALICALAAWISTALYLRKRYDELFR